MTTLARMYFVWRLPIDPCFLFLVIGIAVVLVLLAIVRPWRRPRD